jgi:hypothetical protein
VLHRKVHFHNRLGFLRSSTLVVLQNCSQFASRYGLSVHLDKNGECRHPSADGCSSLILGSVKQDVIEVARTSLLNRWIPKHRVIHEIRPMVGRKGLGYIMKKPRKLSIPFRCTMTAGTPECLHRSCVPRFSAESGGRLSGSCVYVLGAYFCLNLPNRAGSDQLVHLVSSCELR